jgi:hypothetical protein
MIVLKCIIIIIKGAILFKIVQSYSSISLVETGLPRAQVERKASKFINQYKRLKVSQSCSGGFFLKKWWLSVCGYGWVGLASFMAKNKTSYQGTPPPPRTTG